MCEGLEQNPPFFSPTLSLSFLCERGISIQCLLRPPLETQVTLQGPSQASGKADKKKGSELAGWLHSCGRVGPRRGIHMALAWETCKGRGTKAE